MSLISILKKTAVKNGKFLSFLNDHYVLIDDTINMNFGAF